MEKKRSNLTAGVVGLVAVIGVVGLAGYLVSRPEPEVRQGSCEASEYRVSGKVPGRIEHLCVKEGSYVHKGDTLVIIDSPEVRAKLAQVNAMKSAAIAQSTKAKNGAMKEQIEGAYQLWQQALVQEDIMKKSLDRMQRLYDENVISSQKYDEVKAKYDASVAQEKAAKSQYDMALSGTRNEDKAAAAAVVSQAEGALQEVQAYLSELYLTSPCDGYVSAIYPKEGELVGTGAPIMSVIDMNDIWFTFNVREDMLHGMKNGDIFKVAIPALDYKEVDVKVNYIAVRESYATWKATKETGSYDCKTFEVRAVPQSRLDDARPGMTAIIR